MSSEGLISTYGAHRTYSYLDYNERGTSRLLVDN